MVNLTRYNIVIILSACFGAYSYGFSNAVFGTSIGEPGFYEYFSLNPKSDHTASILGAISALFCAGAAFGAVVQGFTGDWLGRVKALQIGAIISIIGTAVVAGSVNIPQLFVFRFITGLGVGQLLALVPLYIAEVAPPHRRGLLSALTGCSNLMTLDVFTFIGPKSRLLTHLSSAWIGYGTYFATNLTVQWRMPLCLCRIAPILLLIFTFWLPESPRWLIWDSQNTRAWEIIQKIHHDPTDNQDLAAYVEYIQIEKQVAYDKETKAGYIQMFTVPSWRKRTFLAILVIFAVQSAGINGVTTYLILEAEETGLTGSMPLLIYAIYVVVAVSVNFLNAAFLDKIGRKKMLLMGLAWTGLCLFATTLLEWKYVGTGNKKGNAAAIFFINLFAFGVGFFLDPTQFVIRAEISPTTIRAKGLTISLFTYFVASILHTAPGPTAFGNIGQWYYMVSIGCDVVSFGLIREFLPETTGLSLEKMGALFNDNVVTHMTADGHGLVEVDAMAEFKGEGFATGVEHAGGYGDEKVGTHRATTTTEVHSSNQSDL